MIFNVSNNHNIKLYYKKFIHGYMLIKNPKIPCNKFKMLMKILSGLCLTVVNQSLN